MYPYIYVQTGTLSTVIESEACLLLLWKHECTRVFADRFTIIEDKIWFDEELLKIVEEEFGPQMRKKTETTPVFVDFMRYSFLGFHQVQKSLNTRARF